MGPLQYITTGSLTCTILSQEHRLERRRQGLTGQATTAVVARENAFGSLTPRSWCSGSMTRSRTCWTDDATARWTLSLWKRSEMSICIIIYICGGQVVNESVPCSWSLIRGQCLTRGVEIRSGRGQTLWLPTDQWCKQFRCISSVRTFLAILWWPICFCKFHCRSRRAAAWFVGEGCRLDWTRAIEIWHRLWAFPTGLHSLSDRRGLSFASAVWWPRDQVFHCWHRRLGCDIQCQGRTTFRDESKNLMSQLVRQEEIIRMEFTGKICHLFPLFTGGEASRSMDDVWLLQEDLSNTDI